MTGLLIALVLLGPVISVIGSLAAGLMAALGVFCVSAGIELSAGSMAVLFLVVAAIPSAAFLSAALLRQLIERSARERYSGLELLAVCLSALLALQSGRVVSVFGAAGYLGTARSTPELAEIASIAIGNALFVGSLTALTVGLLAVSMELLCGFAARATRISIPVSLPALRQILMLAAIAAGFDLCIGLFSRTLAPLTLLRGILP